MFYLFLALVLIAIGIKYSKMSDGGSLAGTSMVAIAFVLIPLCCGLSVYPSLAGLKEEVTVLETEIDTVRSAHYTVESGTLVGGSLDNIKQSTILSEYITRVARKKANYNKELVQAQIRRRLAMFRWFADGLFISEEVNNLTLLK